MPGADLHHRMASALTAGRRPCSLRLLCYGACRFFCACWVSFKTWHLNMFSLIALGTAAAYLFSLFALLFPQFLPEAFMMNGMAPLYFEAAAVSSRGIEGPGARAARAFAD